MASEIFKRCPMCAAEWRNRGIFLGDGRLRLEGYQADFDDLKAGLLYFTHLVDDCRSTMSIKAEEFFDLVSQPPFSGRKTGSSECPGYCLQRENLEPCPAECECASIRELLQVLKQMPAGTA